MSRPLRVGRETPRRPRRHAGTERLTAELVRELRGLVAASQARGSRIALTRAEAARSLGMSIDSFERYVQPEVRLIRCNSLRLVPVSELEQWVERNAERTLRRRP